MVRPVYEPDYDLVTEAAAASLESFANSGPTPENKSTPMRYNDAPLPSIREDQGVSNARNSSLNEAFTTIRVPVHDSLQSTDAHLSWFIAKTPRAHTIHPRIIALRELLEYMPSPAQTEYLVGLYESKVHWRFQIVDMQAFKAEVRQYWSLCANGEQDFVDPLWIAVFYIVVALAVSSRPINLASGRDVFGSYSNEQIGAIARTFHSSSIRALHVGDCMGHPRIRTIQ